MAISHLEIEVVILRVSLKWTRKFKNIPNIKEKKNPKLKNIDNITKLFMTTSAGRLVGLNYSDLARNFSETKSGS